MDRLALSPVALPVLGIPVAFVASSDRLRSSVERTFGGWRRVSAFPDLLTETEVSVTLKERPTVGGGGKGEGAVADTPSYAMPSWDRLEVRYRGASGVADLGSAAAILTVPPSLDVDSERFRHGVLEALTLFLITGRDRHPLHAATLGRDGSVLLLMGPSGSGKSTLAYAAARRGWTVLGDDVAYVAREPCVRFWALPTEPYLSPEAAHGFPELAGAVPVVRPNGKRKVRAPCDPPDPTLAPRARAIGICLLQAGRSRAHAVLDRADTRDVVTAVTVGVAGGFDRYQSQAPEVARAMAGVPAWRLAVAADAAVTAAVLDPIAASLTAAGRSG